MEKMGIKDGNTQRKDDITDSKPARRGAQKARDKRAKPEEREKPGNEEKTEKAQAHL